GSGRTDPASGTQQHGAQTRAIALLAAGPAPGEHAAHGLVDPGHNPVVADLRQVDAPGLAAGEDPVLGDADGRVAAGHAALVMLERHGVDAELEVVGLGFEQALGGLAGLEVDDAVPRRGPGDAVEPVEADLELVLGWTGEVVLGLRRVDVGEADGELNALDL